MKVNFVKTMACFFAGASMLASCQKEDVVTPMVEDEAGVKYAETIATSQDKRALGTRADWMGANGTLNYLVEMQELPSRMPYLFEDNGRLIPSGIQVVNESFIYVTYVGNVADFNNVLGYYYYDPAEVYVDSEVILNQIYRSNNKGIYFKNIIYDHTNDLEFGVTFKLSDNEGNKFKPGTVIGFCVMPNAGGDAVSIGKNGTKLPNVKMKDNNPIFIATDKGVNKDGVISHIVGQSACGDLVIGFEDLNSSYSGRSDQDFNDLVFIIGDNLDNRSAKNLKAYTCECDEARLWTFGDKCQMDHCGEATEVRLMAGQHMVAGTITVSNDEEYLYVTYETTGKWVMEATHLFVGIGEIPNGNGQFPYTMEHNTNVTKYTYSILLSELKTEGGCLWVAAHAQLNGETGWGEGIAIGKNWSMKFPYCLQECE